MKCRRTGLGQGEYGSVLMYMASGDSESSTTSAPGPAWLPSVAPIEELWRVDFRVRMGGEMSTTEDEPA